MRCGRTATTRPSSAAAPRATTRTGSSACSSAGRTGAVPQVVDIAITAQGEEDRPCALGQPLSRSSPAPGSTTRLRALKARVLRSAQERGYVDAKLERHESSSSTPRRGPPTSTSRSSPAAGTSSARSRSSRTRSATGCSWLPALRRGQPIRRSASAAPIRARGQQLLLDRHGDLRGTGTPRR